MAADRIAVGKAFPDGNGGTIGIKVQSAGKDNVEIVLSDNGCGMTPEVRRNAFEPFFTTRRDQGSTGLGLHIVHNVVTSCLGGRIHLDSESGQGTKIHLVLPRVAPAAPTVQ
jgi:signal transduction histidine kinase